MTIDKFRGTITTVSVVENPDHERIAQELAGQLGLRTENISSIDITDDEIRVHHFKAPKGQVVSRVGDAPEEIELVIKRSTDG